MNEERKKILEMLSEGKITVEEAEKLMEALSKDQQESKEIKDASGTKVLKYLRVLVEPKEIGGDRVNIRVPLNLIRAGLKWASFIPKEAQEKVDKVLTEKGLDLNFKNMSKENVEELIRTLDDLEIDIEGKEKVKVYCE
jgi:polyhydroxyalkanoate synthesis regulator phasin